MGQTGLLKIDQGILPKLNYSTGKCQVQTTELVTNFWTIIHSADEGQFVCLFRNVKPKYSFIMRYVPDQSTGASLRLTEELRETKQKGPFKVTG